MANPTIGINAATSNFPLIPLNQLDNLNSDISRVSVKVFYGFLTDIYSEFERLLSSPELKMRIMGEKKQQNPTMVVGFC
ncbi:hypothetical protein ACNQKP_12150 [Bdellovibrio bacteriovorus]|uniref:hypothetical protein n=1 Tax=Bdellovibrio bacteriovorus TaxID=959 RepID=UPI003AA7EDD4